jgi:predicted Zn-dependent peptidase
VTVESHTLSNGLRIVTEHMPGLQSAALGVWVTAGGRHERAEQNGIAHFLEHMAFKGTAGAARCRSPRRSRMWAATSTPIPRAR